MSRLTIDMTEQQHADLHAIAALHGKTVGEYAIARLFPAGEPEQAWLELKAVLGRRIADGLAGKVSSRTVAEIVNDELGADERA